MAPPRQRAAAIADDSRSEASSGTREYRATAPKRKTGAAKEKASVTSAPVNAEPEEQPRVSFSVRISAVKQIRAAEESRSWQQSRIEQQSMQSEE